MMAFPQLKKINMSIWFLVTRFYHICLEIEEKLNLYYYNFATTCKDWVCFFKVNIYTNTTNCTHTERVITIGVYCKKTNILVKLSYNVYILGSNYKSLLLDNFFVLSQTKILNSIFMGCSLHTLKKIKIR